MWVTGWKWTLCVRVCVYFLWWSTVLKLTTLTTATAKSFSLPKIAISLSNFQIVCSKCSHYDVVVCCVFCFSSSFIPVRCLNSFRSCAVLSFFLFVVFFFLFISRCPCVWVCLRFTLFRLNCCLSHFQREPHLNNHSGNPRCTATIFDGIFILKFLRRIRSTFQFTVCTTFLCNTLNSYGMRSKYWQ